MCPCFNDSSCSTLLEGIDNNDDDSIGSNNSNNKNNHVRLLQKQLCGSAARHGNLPALQYLRSVGCEWDHLTCGMSAAYFGHLPILQWMLHTNHPLDETIINAPIGAFAATNGQWHVLQWAQRHGFPMHENIIFSGIYAVMWDQLVCWESHSFGNGPILPNGLNATIT